MNKLLATLVAGTFAVVASSAFAQGTTPAAPMTPATPSTMEKAKEAPMARPKFDEKAAQDLSRNSATDPAQAKANVDKSKMDPRTKAKYDEKSQQALSDKAGTDPAMMKENVAKSKAQGPRQKIDLSKMSKQEKQDLYRQLQKENTGQ